MSGAQVVNAKARAMQAIDLVNINFKDLEHLQAESEAGAAMGFTGKQCIHPAQVGRARPRAAAASQPPADCRGARGVLPLG